VIFFNHTEKLTDWQQFQSLASELIPPQIQIYSGEVDKAAHDVKTLRLGTHAGNM
jgi:hypothetical protein